MPPGKIIILNGASSSGKTSILKALQECLDAPFIDAGLDRFLWMLPKRYLEKPLWDDVLGLADFPGVTGQALVHGMHQAIAALSCSGLNVVADHVMIDQVWVWHCAALFVDLPAYFIGVRCPLTVLEAREKMRKDRTLGQARKQHELVHMHGVYDLEVDTAQSDAAACAAKIAGYVTAGPTPRAFRLLANQIGFKPNKTLD